MTGSAVRPHEHDGLAHTWSLCGVAAFALVLPLQMRVPAMAASRDGSGGRGLAVVGADHVGWAGSGRAGRLPRHVLYLGAAVLLVLPLALREGPGPLRTVPTSRPMVWLGEICNGVFAFHMIVLVGFYAATGRAPFSGGFLLVLPVTLDAAIVLWATGSSSGRC